MSLDEKAIKNYAHIMHYKAELNAYKPDLAKEDILTIISILQGEYMELMSAVARYQRGMGCALDVALEAADCGVPLAALSEKVEGFKEFARYEDMLESMRIHEGPWVGGTDAESDARRRE